MFKVGNRIVCINNEGYENHLKINESYIIQKIITKTGLIILLNHEKCAFGIYRFISVVEQRKQKLEKICSKLEIE